LRWKFFSSATLSDDAVIGDLKRYFNETRCTLGEKLFLELFFQIDNEESYLDNLSELNRDSFLEELHSTKEILSKMLKCKLLMFSFSIKCHSFKLSFYRKDKYKIEVEKYDGNRNGNVQI